MRRDDIPRLTRRGATRLFGTAAVGALAGCLGGGDSADDEEETNDTDDANASEESGGNETNDSARPAVDAEDRSTGGTLRFFGTSIAPSLDPHFTQGFGTSEMQIPYNRLFTYDTDLEWEMELANEMEIPDDTTYVFSIREGVTFHDGSDWNADVAAWNLERMLSEYADISANLDVIDEIEASADDELTIHLSEAFAPFLDNLNGNAYFVSQAALEDRDDEWLQRNPVGTGPFALEEWDRQSEVITFERFEDYWKEDEAGTQLPYVDTWEVHAVTEESTRFNAYQDEGNYLHSVPADNVEELEGNDESVVTDTIAQSNTIDFLSMNTDVAPFDDPDVREAAYYAIDNEQVLDFAADLDPLTGPLPESNWGANEGLSVEYDPERARSLLEGAGTDGAFTLKLFADDPARRDSSTVVKQMLDQVGFDVTLESIESQTLLEQVSNGDFTMYSGHWGGGGHLDPYGNLNVIFHSDGLYNYMTNFSTDEIDGLLDDALETTDRDERAGLYQEAEQLVFDAHPQIWFGRFKTYIAHEAGVHGVDPLQPTGYFPNYDQVWIDEDA